MIDWLAFTARRPLYNTYMGYWMYTHVLLNRRRKSFAKLRKLVNRENRFFLTGYPRSGNTYLTGLVRQILQVNDFGHHLHTPLSLKIAIDKRLKTYVIFRSPMENVMSLGLLNSNQARRFVRFRWMENAYALQKSLLLLYLREYIHYHEYVLSRSDRITLFSSDQVFSQTQDVLRRIAIDNGLDVSQVDDENCARARIDFLKHKGSDQNGQLTAGVPNPQKDLAKRKLREKVEDHPLMYRAISIFKRMEDESLSATNL
ncbi:hypothetical protein [Wenzhouxiangella sp. EGI_FJ10305]|uniref:hypothetical protein n=1 Tax=Wenzhouxiangella sp. EGI_FJ10305 TaxID=3243768 RepID=UPI0035DD03F7